MKPQDLLHIVSQVVPQKVLKYFENSIKISEDKITKVHFKSFNIPTNWIKMPTNEKASGKLGYRI
jgi:hypothetical protein